MIKDDDGTAAEIVSTEANSVNAMRDGKGVELKEGSAKEEVVVGGSSEVVEEPTMSTRKAAGKTEMLSSSSSSSPSSSSSGKDENEQPRERPAARKPRLASMLTKSVLDATAVNAALRPQVHGRLST